MRIEYEPKHDILNLEFLEGAEIEESMEVEGIIFDYSKDKKIVSIEILDAGKRIMPRPLDLIDLAIVREK